MDKVRHPLVIRTWTVERTKTAYRPPQLAHLRPNPGKQSFRNPAKPSRGPNPRPKARE